MNLKKHILSKSIKVFVLGVFIWSIVTIRNFSFEPRKEYFSEYSADNIFSKTFSKSIVNPPKIALLDTQMNKESIKYLSKYFTNKDKGSDELNHGDEMLSILRTYAPRNTIIHWYDVTDAQGNVSRDVVFKQLKKIKEAQYNIISMSISLNTYDAKIDKLLEEISKKGGLLVAAAGNSNNGKERIHFPASSQFVLSIGGVDRNGELSSQSKFGKIDFVMPFCKESDTRKKTIEGTSVSAVLFSAMALYVTSERRTEKIQRLKDSSDKKLIEKNGFYLPIVE